jgi:hypothetical protein
MDERTEKLLHRAMIWVPVLTWGPIALLGVYFMGFAGLLLVFIAFTLNAIAARVVNKRVGQ